MVRIFVTEQTRSAGTLATKRLLAPDLHEGDDEVLLRTVRDARGPECRWPPRRPKTPVRIQLPSPIGANGHWSTEPSTTPAERSDRR